jgi:excisionase family DNA binding protein
VPVPNVIAYHIKDAPAASGTTRTKIYEAIRKGELQARKNGRRTIILADDLAAWVRSLPLAA